MAKQRAALADARAVGTAAWQADRHGYRTAGAGVANDDVGLDLWQAGIAADSTAGAIAIRDADRRTTRCWWAAWIGGRRGSGWRRQSGRSLQPSQTAVSGLGIGNQHQRGGGKNDRSGHFCEHDLSPCCVSGVKELSSADVKCETTSRADTILLGASYGKSMPYRRRSAKGQMPTEWASGGINPVISSGYRFKKFATFVVRDRLNDSLVIE